MVGHDGYNEDRDGGSWQNSRLEFGFIARAVVVRIMEGGE